jgi:hypothetical protein
MKWSGSRPGHCITVENVTGTTFRKLDLLQLSGIEKRKRSFQLGRVNRDNFNNFISNNRIVCQHMKTISNFGFHKEQRTEQASVAVKL